MDELKFTSELGPVTRQELMVLLDWYVDSYRIANDVICTVMGWVLPACLVPVGLALAFDVPYYLIVGIALSLFAIMACTGITAIVVCAVQATNYEKIAKILGNVPYDIGHAIELLNE